MRKTIPVLLTLGLSLTACAGAQRRAEGMRLYGFHASEDSLHVAAWYLVGPGGVVVFDAPMLSMDVEALTQEIRINTPQRVDAVIVTSALPERYAGSGELTSRTGADLYATASTRETIQQEGPAAVAALQEAFDVRVPMVVVEPEDDLPTGERVRLAGVRMEILSAGAGPTNGMAAIYLPDLDTLIPGGLVFNGVHPRVSGGRLPVWIASLEELGKVEATRVLPGAGGVGGMELVQTSILYLRTLEAEVKAQEPFERPLTDEVEAAITAAMTGAYPGWKLEEALAVSVADEWLRQGGFPAEFAEPSPEAAPAVPEGEAAPGEADEESLAPLFDMPAPEEGSQAPVTPTAGEPTPAPPAPPVPAGTTPPLPPGP